MASLLLLASSSAHQPALAQAWQCRAPQFLPRPVLEIPRPGEVRRVPVTGYTLSLIWRPEACKGRERDPARAIQCDGKIGDFGFFLHGLWPEGRGANYPQYCRSVGLLPKQVIANNICTTPDVQLMQHEWAKHGSCMTHTPESYFGAAKLMFDAIEYPDMDRLSRKLLTVAGLAEAFADANQGLPANAVRSKLNDRGWLEEVRICLGKDMRPRRCPNGAPGAKDKAAVKIWRGS